MPTEGHREMNRKVFRGPVHYGVAFDEHGKARTVASVGQFHPDDQVDTAAAETAEPRRVADGTADGGKRSVEEPRPTPMNQLLRDLAFGAYARKMRQGG